MNNPQSSAYGKLIVIEGTDGSGKKTQTAKLLERMNAEKVPAESIDFPRYGTPSAHFVEKYLHGGYGTAMEVGPYAGSMFYAVDRYEHSFEIREHLKAGKSVICDRYVSANMGHQAGKIENEAERDAFMEWLWDLEYVKFNLPKPDLTIFLYVSPETSQRLMAGRTDKDYLKGKKQDIHEADLEHMQKASDAFLYVAQKYGWTVIDCAPKTAEHPEGELLSIEAIHEQVWREVNKVL